MGEEITLGFKPHPFSSLLHIIVLLLFVLFNPVSFASSDNQGSGSSSSSTTFSPVDNHLIDCGSSQQTRLSDGRIFKSERDSVSFLSTNEDVQISVDFINVTTSSNVPSSLISLFRSARIFPSESKYTFTISKLGRHFLRLYFYPLPHPSYNLRSAIFKVITDKYVLLEDFSMTNSTSFVFKEYLVNVVGDKISLVFKPKKNSFAFINAIEVVSAPDSLFSDIATLVSAQDFNGLSNYGFQIMYRINVGGPIISPENDTLYRSWNPDVSYNVFPQGTKNVIVDPKTIKHPLNGSTPFVAPNLVYASAQKMQDSMKMDPNFNLTWKFMVEQGYTYLIRFHFCDIVSKTLNTLYFNVYVNQMMALSNLDLSTLTGGLATSYYKDLVAKDSSIRSNIMMIQVGPTNTQSAGIKQAILNGLEVIKVSNKADSFAGLYNINGKYIGPELGSKNMKIVAAVGLGMAFIAMLLVGFVYVRSKNKHQGSEKRNNVSSWLLPIQPSNPNYLSSKSSSRRSSIFGSHKSKGSGYHYSFLTSSNCFGRFFTLSELQHATQNFDEKVVIGIGGFGKVFLGVLDDGTKLAIKRGNPSSEQGINEFRTEIEMLSKLRHRHLVSMVGFCDEQSEMILVYEYMANGPLRDHLYGSNLPCLSWKQRLEICIGAARGLHYLHTGAAQRIIHRDVKTTNILLDDNFVAKVADFGLSKATPSLDQTHVSTAVKGSFGYLDPEYFRRQQLTEKSDVYSFGVVLFEVLSARAVINPKLPRGEVSLAEWAMGCHRKGMIEKIIDSQIVSDINPESLKKFIEAAEKCLAEYGVDRPSMGDVLWNLEYSLQLQEATLQIDHTQQDDSKRVIDDKERQGVEESSEGGPDFVVCDDYDVSTVGSSLFSHNLAIQGR